MGNWESSLVNLWLLAAVASKAKRRQDLDCRGVARFKSGDYARRRSRAEHLEQGYYFRRRHMISRYTSTRVTIECLIDEFQAVFTLAYLIPPEQYQYGHALGQMLP